MAAKPFDVLTKEEGEAMCESLAISQVVFQAMTFVIILIDLIVALIKVIKKK